MTGTISMSSNKSAWRGSLQWSYSGGYVSVTMYTWKTDGYPSSATSGANFQAQIIIGSSTSQIFTFQQQEVGQMTVGTFRTYVSGSQVTISGRVDAPYGVSMYGNPLTGSQTVTLYTEPEEPDTEPSTMLLDVERVKMGGSLLISFIRDNASCTHNVYYRASGGRQTQMVSGALLSHLWQVPDFSALCTDSLEIAVTLYCDTYEGSTYIGRTQAVITVCVPDPTVPQCSQTAVMGGSLAITLSRAAENFTHDVSFTFSGVQGQIADGAEAACLWEIPLSLASEIPLLTQGTATITCVTKNGRAEVGSKTVTVLLQVPDNDLTKPRASMVLTPSGDLDAVFAGMFIRGRTGVQAEFTAESDYSRIGQYQLTVDGIPVSGNPAVSALLKSYGDVTVTGRVIDARGYARELTQVISVVAYDKPRVIPYPGESSVVAVRCNSDGSRNPNGQHLLIRAGRKYTALNTDAGQLNFCSLLFRYKSSGDSVYSDFYTLLDDGNTDTDYVQTVVENAVSDLKTGYTVQLEAVDTLGGYSVITVPVSALTIPLHLGAGGSNVSVGKYCDYSRANAFEVGFTTYFDTGIALRRIFDGGRWSVGTELGSTVPEAEVSAAALYSVFIAVCEEKPNLLLRHGNALYGSGIKLRRQHRPDAARSTRTPDSPLRGGMMLEAFFKIHCRGDQWSPVRQQVRLRPPSGEYVGVYRTGGR